MLVNNTPVQDHLSEFGLMVKREDLSCPPPGPPFSKTRGVFAHIRDRPEEIIGVLDTYHSQAGHAVAQACSLLGKTCVNYYPRYKRDPGPHAAQTHSMGLGAQLQPLPAGPSWHLFHQAKADLAKVNDSYMMPNALKLPEMITETAAEVRRTLEARPEVGTFCAHHPVFIPISSGTIAAGVITGFHEAGLSPRFILHQGYNKPEGATLKYMLEMSGMTTFEDTRITFINERYNYKDQARPGPTPPWPANAYYDLKAFRWWMAEGRDKWGEALMWNIG